jgi:lysophospholipase L1-like esterase
VHWLRRIARQRFYFQPDYVTGISSMGSVHLLNVQVPQLLAVKPRPNIAMVQIGTNDNGVLAPADTVANVLASVRKLNAAGILVFLLSVVPQGTWNNARKQWAAEVNRQYWLMAHDPALAVQFVDLNPTYINYATGSPIAAMQFSDLVHDTPTGGLTKAQKILPALEPFLPQGSELLPITTADIFDPANAPTGNMLDNGLFTGTAGTLSGAGASGQVASGWQGVNSAADASTVTVAFSKSVHPTLSGLPQQVMTVGGVGNNAAQFRFARNFAALPAGLIAGNRVYAEMDVSWANAVNIWQLWLRLSFYGSTTREVMDGGTLTPAGTAQAPLPVSASGIMRTPPLEVPAGATSCLLRLEGQTLVNGQPCSMTVTAGRASFRRAGATGLLAA